MITQDDLSVVRQRLAETALWCQLHASVNNPAGSLRTLSLAPPSLYEMSGGIVSQLSKRILEIMTQYPGETPADLAVRQSQEFSHSYRSQVSHIQEHRQLIVDDLSRKRKLLLDGMHDNIFVSRKNQEFSVGRIIVNSIDDSIRDGSSEVGSCGFFDADDLPPWDTWLCYVQTTNDADRDFSWIMLSWIPAIFLDLAEEGIRVNPVNCLWWADYV